MPPVPRQGANGAANRFFTVSSDPACDLQARETLLAAQSRFVSADGCGTFYEYVAPPVELLIFGAGYDAVPLLQFAVALGWRVTVADSRPATATFRYPGFDRVVPFEDAPVSERSVAVLMTHNYAEDLDLLRRLLPAGLRYIGADSPEAIALSIAAEIQAVLSGRSGGMLRFRSGPIYNPMHELVA